MIIGIIPARYSSSRLPGKPLLKIGGKPMLQHTFESASKSKLLSDIIIAVDDERVYDVAKSFGAQVQMTPKEMPTGSDRIASVAEKLSGTDIIVNIQGDEPFIPAKMIDEAIEPLLFDSNVEVSTLAKRIVNEEDLNSPSVTKVVFDYNNYALYFSRSPIPYVRDVVSDKQKLRLADIYKHFGLYVFKKEKLLQFVSLRPTDLERYEKLEQLRMLENGFKIKIVITEMESISVDTSDDLDKVRLFYENMGSKNII
ncbi:MAG: 3-deoxy-manno-octulosonate cytidylyltransferase [Melioribacteraceae bacterium]|nr:3-deoxy-manno-octulosonate cytidylyltransferase [Melioribacteraceae bacterium]